jgi:hypothetical protein
VLLYVSTVLLKVYLGYGAGVANPTATHGTPVSGQVVSEWVRGVLVLQLWPFDFPLNTKASTNVQPLHELWHPRVSTFLATQFGISGMERLSVCGRCQWVAQRWLCEATTNSGILNALQAADAGKPREIPAIHR